MQREAPRASTGGRQTAAGRHDYAATEAPPLGGGDIFIEHQQAHRRLLTTPDPRR